jgi:hypothetical protein
LRFPAFFGYGIPFERIPDLLSGVILGLSTNKNYRHVHHHLHPVILGMFIDGSVVILLFTPIFLPLAVKVGWDPVHFGILFCHGYYDGQYDSTSGACNERCLYRTRCGPFLNMQKKCGPGFLQPSFGGCSWYSSQA